MATINKNDLLITRNFGITISKFKVKGKFDYISKNKYRLYQRHRLGMSQMIKEIEFLLIELKQIKGGK